MHEGTMHQGFTAMAMVRFLTFFLAAVAIAGPASARTVHLRFDIADEQLTYAAKILSEAIDDSGSEITGQADGSAFEVTIALDPRELGPEAFATWSDGRSLIITGGDGRGAIYGAQAVAEQLRNGVALGQLRSEREAPAVRFRAIKFNLPWDSYRSSSALDLHYDTVRDVKYWEAFLDMMARNRFNALTLWNLHPFPYMIRARNFPEASRFSDTELARWRKLYRAIFKMAKVRGIDTYVVNWNILVSPEFAKAHHLEGYNFYPFYKGDANKSEIVKRYTRESVTQLLEEYPDLTGFGFTMGEQMGGMTPRQRQKWIDETIIAGMRKARRPAKLIFRAPVSADLGQNGSTDVTTERLTRDAIERLNDFDGPVWLDLKFNWSHGHSTTRLVKVHGGPLSDTFFNPLPKNYRIVWTVRNEDFYALRWGVPDFVRKHIELNASQSYTGGYIVGSENYIPAKDYFTAIDAPVAWKYAFERQWLFYELWGRLLYDPATPDSVFEAEFVHRYGESARPLLQAYALASATALRFASSIDFTWDFTIYSEGMMVLSDDGFQPLSVERLIVQRPLLPEWLSVEDFVAKRAAGESMPDEAVTPLMLADRLEADCTEALRLVEGISTAGNPSLMYEVSDVKTWANLGLYYAEKLRGAVALQTFRTAGDKLHKQEAVDHLKKSLARWDEVIAITRPIYKDMPLAHYNPPNNQRNDNNLFHWARVRESIAHDVEVAESATHRENTGIAPSGIGAARQFPTVDISAAK